MSKGHEPQKGRVVRLPYARTMVDAGTSKEIAILGEKSQMLRVKILKCLENELKRKSIDDVNSDKISNMRNDIFYKVIAAYKKIDSNKYEDALPMISLLVEGRVQDILRLRKIGKLENLNRKLDTSLNHLAAQFNGSNQELTKITDDNIEMQKELGEAFELIGRLESEIDELKPKLADS